MPHFASLDFFRIFLCTREEIHLFLPSNNSSAFLTKAHKATRTLSGDGCQNLVAGISSASSDGSLFKVLNSAAILLFFSASKYLSEAFYNEQIVGVQTGSCLYDDVSLLGFYRPKYDQRLRTGRTSELHKTMQRCKVLLKVLQGLSSCAT